MDWIDQLPAEIRAFLGPLRGRPNFAEHLAKFAAHLHERGKEQDALSRDLALRAWELAPSNPHVRHAAEWAIRKSAPLWHFRLVHDQARNDVYERALRRFVTPETVVLEIGAGSGILALLVTRAGASHVYTCEMEPLIARAAQENVARNGCAGRITVIPKKSTDLLVGVDLPVQADLLVSEIVDNNLLAEDVLPIMEDAHARLLRPGGVVLPAQIAARGALVGGAPWTESCRMETASGFDLSAFNRLAPPTVTPEWDGRGLDDALSDDVELFRFDFRAPVRYPAETKTIALAARRAGLAHGLLQWIWLDFAEDIQFDNRPPAKSVWHPVLHVFPEPLALREGYVVRLTVEHDRKYIRAWPEAALV